MKTRIFMSMLVIALAAALVGGATMAIFTDMEQSLGNTFAAGTVDITVGTTTLAVNSDNIDPGDTKTGSFSVTNAGTLELRYSVSAATSGALFGGANPAVVGGLDDDQNVVLAPGATATVTFTVTLPAAAGNEYQGVSGTVNLTINAVQTANNPF